MCLRMSAVPTKQLMTAVLIVWTLIIAVAALVSMTMLLVALGVLVLVIVAAFLADRVPVIAMILGLALLGVAAGSSVSNAPGP